MITPEDVEEMFTYHAPKENQIPLYEDIRRDAKLLAHTILRCTPGCADQSAAIRLLREVVMTANASIALEGLV